MKILGLLLVLALTACGFTPVHGSAQSRKFHDFPGVDLSVSMGVVPTTASPKHTGQLFEKYFLEATNPTSITKKSEYQLLVKITVDQSPIAIQQDSRITRFNIFANAEYELKNLQGESLKLGHMRREGSFDATSASQYATFSSELDAQNRIIKELASDMAYELFSLIMDKPKPKKKKIDDEDSARTN